jgi:hypothetical protein
MKGYEIVDCIHLAQTVAGSCEHGDERSSSLKDWEILELTGLLWVLQTGIYSVELVICFIKMITLYNLRKIWCWQF